MKLKKWQEILDRTEAKVTTVEELVAQTNDQLDDALFIAEDIHIPEKKDIKRCYRTDFELKTNKEAKELMSEKKILLSPKYKNADFFVYNDRTEELVPFQKNDYLMYDRGYFTFDGTSYISYDDNGKEIGRFSFLQDEKLAA